jgi:hypothetical protein
MIPLEAAWVLAFITAMIGFIAGIFIGVYTIGK